MMNSPSSSSRQEPTKPYGTNSQMRVSSPRPSNPYTHQAPFAHSDMRLPHRRQESVSRAWHQSPQIPASVPNTSSGPQPLAYTNRPQSPTSKAEPGKIIISEKLKFWGCVVGVSATIAAGCFAFWYVLERAKDLGNRIGDILFP